MTNEEILNTTHWNFVVSNGISCVHTRTFPEAYKEQALIAMDTWAIKFATWYSGMSEKKVAKQLERFKTETA